MKEPQSNKLSVDDFKLIGAFHKLYKYTLGNLECDKSVLKDAQRVVDKRKCLLIRGDVDTAIHLGFGVLRAMLDTERYLDCSGNISPELIRFIHADDFINRLSTADFGERREIWKNLFISFDDGSGWVRAIMIAGLGDEYGKDAINHMKLIIRRCDADMVQLIVETALTTDELIKRYGERVNKLLNRGEVIDLKNEDSNG